MNDLLLKYNVPVPRYTSYPPANYFNDQFTDEHYALALSESNQWQPRNISFYFHVPFCKQLCYFCGCNSYALRKEHTVDAYMKAMAKELKMVIGKLDKTRLVSQIHYGGGTPNAVNPSYLHELNNIIKANFNFIDNPEIAIECNPAYLNEKQIIDLKEAGFNRFSLGVQDFNTEVLKAVNREWPSMPLEKMMALIKVGNENIKINLDFIYGLPNQTAKSFARTIERAASLQPDRLVTFSYAHVPWVSKIQKKLEAQGLPESNEKVLMNQMAIDIMVRNQYEVIGMDHYAQKDDELSIARREHGLHRNFQGYCTLRTTGQVYAIGVTGISQLDGVYAQNTKSIDDYIELINNGLFTSIKGYRLNKSEKLVRETISDLMCNQRIVWNSLAERLGVPVQEIMNATALKRNGLEVMELDGLITRQNNDIFITEAGALFLRNVAAALDPLTGTEGKSFSKPV